ncbi:unnamed protein product [Schistosoma turkestanicum]|nr:unnamed protein product [Schistosoma turkestanicum]
MEKFIEIFMKLDNNNDGVIEKNELIQYCKKENLDMSMVYEWLKLIDMNSDGKISFKEFCMVFGLNYEEIYDGDRRQFFDGPPPSAQVTRGRGGPPPRGYP